MEEIDMRKVMEILISLLAEQEGVVIDYSFRDPETQKKETA